jgi:hypothetical protein
MMNRRGSKIVPKGRGDLHITFFGQKVKYFPIPERDFFNGIVQADVQDVAVPKHGMQCNLNQEGGFTDARPGQDGAK